MIVLDRGIFLRERSSRRKILRSKAITDEFTRWPKQRWCEVINPNSIRSYKIVQKLSPKQAARGVAQSPYPTYRHGKACLSKQPPWRAAGDPRLARGRSRVRAPGPVGTLRALFFSTLPSFLLRTFPTEPVKPVVRLGLILSLITAIWTFWISVNFRCNLWRNTLLNLWSHSVCTYPCERISISPDMTIVVQCDKRACAWCGTRACLAF